MKAGECLKIEEIAELVSCSPDDPRALHLESCPRCRARLMSYQKFIDSTCARGFKPEEARAYLEAALDREISSPIKRRPQPRPGWFRDVIRRLWKPALRPVWAVGVIVLAVWGIQEVRDLDRVADDRIILREGQGPETVRPELLEPQGTEDGGLVLSWTSFADADRFEVSFYGSDLEVFHRLDAGSDLSLTVSRSQLLELRNAGESLFWRVTAFRGGDPVARSAIGILSPAHES